MVEYPLLLSNATTIAKVGFYLEQHREQLMVRDAHLAVLRGRRQKNPHYWARGKADGRFVARWNLVVPGALLARSWQEVL